MLCLQLRGDIELAQGQNKPLPSWQMICRRRCRSGGPAVPLTHFVRMVCCWLNIINLKVRGKRAKGEDWERGESEEDLFWEGDCGIRLPRSSSATDLAEGWGFLAPPTPFPRHGWELGAVGWGRGCWWCLADEKGQEGLSGTTASFQGDGLNARGFTEPGASNRDTKM